MGRCACACACSCTCMCVCVCVAFGLLSHGLSHLLFIEPRTDSSGMVSPTIGWTPPPHQLLLKKMPYSWKWRHFLNWGSFISSDSSLGEVDIKLTITQAYGLGDVSLSIIYPDTNHSDFQVLGSDASLTGNLQSILLQVSNFSLLTGESDVISCPASYLTYYNHQSCSS